MKLIVMGLLACATVGLSGCAGIDRMNAQMAAQQHTVDQNRCAGYGYKQGTDAFADCMMAAQHQRDQQWADLQRQKAWERQKQADRDARKDAADAAADAKHQADIQQMMNSNGSDNSFIPKQPDTGTTTSSNCTSTTVSQSSDNAGTSTTTTTCSN